MIRNVLIWTSLLAFASCKAHQTPVYSSSSISEEEQALCQFKGKRLMLVVAPDFQHDANIAQELFRESTHTFLMDASFFEGKAIANSAAMAVCVDRLKRLGKYRVEGALIGSVTGERFLSEMQRLRGEIADFRNASPENADEEVQVMITFTSHGSKEGGTGNLVLGQEEVPFQRVASAIYDNLMTKCGDYGCKSVRPGGRLADEVIVLMDNCFSGNFSDSMHGYLRQQIGYTDANHIIEQSKETPLAQRNKATRFLTYSSSNRGQTAVGAIDGSKSGTLMYAFQQLLPPSFGGDFNNDGAVSFAEVDEYLKQMANGSFLPGARDDLRGRVSHLICGERERIMNEMFQNSQDYRQLFANPTDYAGKSDFLAKAQRPTSWSNLAPSYKSRLAIAVTKPGNHRATGAKDYLAELSVKSEKAKAELPQYAKLLEALYKLIDQNREVYLSEPGVQTTTNTGVVDDYQNSNATEPYSGETTSSVPETFAFDGVVQEVGVSSGDITFEQTGLNSSYRQVFDEAKAYCKTLSSLQGQGDFGTSTGGYESNGLGNSTSFGW